jgi:GNAT superfamily N-acetyltransferase
MTITERIEPPDRAERESYVEAHNAWVAEVDGVIVGFALIDGTDRHVEALFVAPGSEGLRAGQALHAAMLAWAEAEGISELWLSKLEGNAG